MATKKKLLQAAAGNAGGDALNVEDVFSTYLYTGNGSTQTITNDIDLSGEGGLTWIKERDNAESHQLTDTERGNTKVLSSDSTAAEGTVTTRVTSFNSNGFSLGSNASVNQSSTDYASWTFRKAPKFFTCLTYTGDGTNNRKIPHNLGSEVGCYIVKQIDDGRSWSVYHRGANGGTNPENYVLILNDTDAQADADYWNDTAPTATEFTINNYAPINESGGNYIAYLWAHNDGDGDFGPDADADIIKCGSYTGTGSAGNFVDIGFEPQWVMIKNTTSSNTLWVIVDNMRGMPVGSISRRLVANTSLAEANNNELTPAPTGFTPTGSGSYYNKSGDNYIYIAIRRGTAVPESATEVFKPVFGDGTPPAMESGFVVDAAIVRNPSAATNNHLVSRMTGGANLITNSAESEGTFLGGQLGWDYNTGFMKTYGSSVWSAMWKRAPNYFDVVAYTGNSTAGRTVSHNLGVAPEMMWVKKRNEAGYWRVYHKGLNGGTNPEQYGLNLNETVAEYDDNLLWNDTAPTASVFSLGTQGNVNFSGSTYIAYLFASLDGISKVGSYTGNGTSTGDSQNIDCGFTNGARFLLIKRTSGTGMWALYDTERGIAAGNDAQLQLDSSAAEYSGADYVDPYSAGFAVSWKWGNSDSANLNANGATYIFYAIA